MIKFGGIIPTLALTACINSAAHTAPLESAKTSIHSIAQSHTIASQTLGIVSLDSNLSIEYWLGEVQKRFPTIGYADALIVSIHYHEDVIQELDDPARDIGMSLIQKLSETSTPQMLALEKRQSSLSPSEKGTLERLRFVKNQRGLATILLFLIENPPEELQQCRRPNI